MLGWSIKSVLIFSFRFRFRTSHNEQFQLTNENKFLAKGKRKADEHCLDYTQFKKRKLDHGANQSRFNTNRVHYYADFWSRNVHTMLSC